MSNPQQCHPPAPTVLLFRLLYSRIEQPVGSLPRQPIEVNYVEQRAVTVTARVNATLTIYMYYTLSHTLAHTLARSQKRNPFHCRKSIQPDA